MFTFLRKLIFGVGKAAVSRPGRAVLTTAALGTTAAVVTESVSSSINQNILQPVSQPFIDPVKGISTLSLLAIAGMVGMVAFVIIKVVK